jgi:hypothetical protein
LTLARNPPVVLGRHWPAEEDGIRMLYVVDLTDEERARPKATATTQTSTRSLGCVRPDTVYHGLIYAAFRNVRPPEEVALLEARQAQRNAASQRGAQT